MLSTSKACREVHNISTRSLDQAVTDHHKTVPFLTTDILQFLSLCTLCALGSPVTQTERTEHHLFSKWHFSTPFLRGFKFFCFPFHTTAEEKERTGHHRLWIAFWWDSPRDDWRITSLIHKNIILRSLTKYTLADLLSKKTNLSVLKLKD